MQKARTPMPAGISGACRAGPISDLVVKPARQGDASVLASFYCALTLVLGVSSSRARFTCGPAAQAGHIVDRPGQRIEVGLLPGRRGRRLPAQRCHAVERQGNGACWLFLWEQRADCAR